MTASPQLHALLKTRFGYDRFLPMQEEVITSVLEGRDSLVLMPTGGGKSLCYQLPALLMDGVVLVVSPLIALMKDQVDALSANGIPAAFINSTISNREIDRIQLEAVRGRVNLLYVAPERLAVPRFREFLRAFRPSLIAVDEAHCISEWGHDFRPDYRNIRGLRHDLPGVPVIALTATATEQVRADIVEHLGFSDAGNFVASYNRPNLKYIVRHKRQAFDGLVELLGERPGESAIIYCFSRQDTEDVARNLSRVGIPALPYHAGLDPELRHANQDRFIGGEAPVVVATIAFGMGIDKPDVRLIVHYDMPKTLEGYYQETGRAGRDGLPSDCVLFYSYGDKIKQDYFVDRIENPTERRRAEEKLATMVEFSELRTCRRRYLLNYFGEQRVEDSCGACDVCLAVSEEFDATEISQKVLSAVIRTGERFGAGHVIQVLRGSRAAKVLEFGHDELSVYGIAADQSADDLRELFGLLLDAGMLVKPPGEYPTYEVTDHGRDFLQRRDSLTLQRPVRPDAPARGRSGGGRTSTRGMEAALEYDHDLYERLRTLRRGLADKSGVPAFVVFGDTSLQHMAHAVPQSVDSFAAIPGVGQAKLSKYGEVFLKVIQAYASENGLAERSFIAAKTPSRRPLRRPSATHNETKRLLELGLNVGEIAGERGLTQQTVLNHLERLVAGGEELHLAPLMPRSERMQRISEAFDTVGSEMLTPVLEALGSEYTYEELRLVRLWMAQSTGLKGGADESAVQAPQPFL
jgi:ATP-dependent DNA helicase RecQ